MYTAGLDTWLDILSERVCEHPDGHKKVAGGEKTSKGWNSNEAAAYRYPADFNSYLAQAVADLVQQRRSASLAPPEVIKPKEIHLTASGVPTVKASTVRSEAPVETSKAPTETRGVG